MSMDTAFDTAFERLIGHEGGYVNHPDDPGGETNWGITLRTAREQGYTGEMRDLTRGEAKRARVYPNMRRRTGSTNCQREAFRPKRVPKPCLLRFGKNWSFTAHCLLKLSSGSPYSLAHDVAPIPAPYRAVPRSYSFCSASRLRSIAPRVDFRASGRD